MAARGWGYWEGVEGLGQKSIFLSSDLQQHAGKSRDGARRIAFVDGIVVSELAFAVSPPAFDCVVVEHHTRMLIARRDLFGRSARPKVNKRNSRHGSRRIANRGDAAESELTYHVEAPAFDGPVVEHGAAVVIAGGDLRGRPARAEVDGSKGCHVSGGSAFVGRTVGAELTIGPTAPAFDRAVVQDGAGVKRTRGDLFGRSTGTEVDGGQGCH